MNVLTHSKNQEKVDLSQNNRKQKTTKVHINGSLSKHDPTLRKHYPTDKVFYSSWKNNPYFGDNAGGYSQQNSIFMKSLWKSPFGEFEFSDYSRSNKALTSIYILCSEFHTHQANCWFWWTIMLIGIFQLMQDLHYSLWINNLTFVLYIRLVKSVMVSIPEKGIYFANKSGFWPCRCKGLTLDLKDFIKVYQSTRLLKKIAPWLTSSHIFPFALQWPSKKARSSLTCQDRLLLFSERRSQNLKRGPWALCEGKGQEWEGGQ